MTLGNRPGIGLIALAALAVSWLGGAASAQTDEGFAGKWRASVDTGQGEIIYLMDISQGEDGTWTGDLKSDQNPNRVMTFTSITIDGSHILAVVDQGDFKQSFEGNLGGNGKIKGKMRIHAQDVKTETSMTFVPAATPKNPVPEPIAGSPVVNFDSSNPISGSWAVHPSEEDKARTLRLEIGRNAKNEWAGSITDTGTDELTPLRDINLGENTLSFNFRPEGAPFLASFWGRYLPEDDSLKGSLSIGGRSQPLTFERIGAAPGTTANEFADTRPPKPRKHLSHFAAAARVGYWHPIYVLKEKVRNINDITSSKTAFDGGVRWYVQDTIAFQARVFRGGLGFNTNDFNLSLFDPVDGPQGTGIAPRITKDSYLKLDGWEFTINGYVGPSLFPDSRYNPYIIGLLGRTSWELDENGRGSKIITIFDEPVEGKDWHFGAGLGTEYAINERFGLEGEWTWVYTLTQDTQRWTNNTMQWTNTHAFRFSLGAILWF